ncbi:hypothetical protein FF38_08613 [Lucilia cuprina]|uniref:Uncharacterized protein n=1 Tax=Lucilia cuprina TaxID=7375 RepID=A0A0L0C2L8_LUCCU|nr:hypothetical protein FF38_08613 [Lucilia cuprina]
MFHSNLTFLVSKTTLNATGSVLLERQCGGSTVQTNSGLLVRISSPGCSVRKSPSASLSSCAAVGGVFCSVLLLLPFDELLLLLEFVFEELLLLLFWLLLLLLLLLAVAVLLVLAVPFVVVVLVYDMAITKSIKIQLLIPISTMMMMMELKKMGVLDFFSKLEWEIRCQNQLYFWSISRFCDCRRHRHQQLVGFPSGRAISGSLSLSKIERGIGNTNYDIQQYNTDCELDRHGGYITKYNNNCSFKEQLTLLEYQHTQ